MQQSYVLGIDIGTGSVKAVALDSKGQVLHSGQIFYATATKTEQDIELVWQSFQQCIREAVLTLQTPPVAIGLSSAMHSIMAVDENGRPLTKAILWSDTRSTDIAQGLRGTTLGDQLYLATGTPVHSMSPLCKIRWWKENDPVVFSKASKFISIKEAIWYRLFGEYVIDHSLATATGMFNHQQLQWDSAALSFAGIVSQQLSHPVQVTYRNNSLSPDLATLLGLPAGTPFLIGASDGCMANLGSLCLSPAEAAITIGTSAAVRITTTSPVQKPEQMIFNYLLEEGIYVCGGAINNGGNVFQWLLNNLFAGHTSVRTYTDLFHLLTSVPAGSNGLLFLPYLHGERAPIWDEQSCGVYFGLTVQHGLAHMARAAAEGVGFALKQILSILEETCGSVQQLRISGGLVEAAAVMQLLADITGKEVVVQQTEDASAIGAAMLVLKASGMIKDYRTISWENKQVYVPDRNNADVYQAMFPLYKKLYPLLKDSMHSITQL
ncbi:MAG TPA: gluconokinase [Flavisolibacter sp.]|nr:gluconokinase [Flavisolibacter sp.]